MVKLKIDNKLIEVAEGSSILDAAKGGSIIIPTLCYSKGLPHYSSCMVCMVKDNRTGNFIPSCSATAQEGMDIDASSDDVISLRKKAVELLLSEHRAECEAPCKVVCPAGYNIPLMNRLLAAKNYPGVIELITTEIKSGDIKCIDCAAYCENACRRKKIDIPVSIKNMKIFISQQLNTSNRVAIAEDTASGVKLPKPFVSRIGKLEPAEQLEWLKECLSEIQRFREISDFNTSSSEAESCMHCDCRALDNCRLRDIANEFSLKDPKGKLVNSPIQKKINVNTGLVFENSKCIKCGLCVRLCEASGEEPALCFIHRGFVSIISEPLTEDFNNILKTKSKEVIEICPTGALSKF
jgi:predicted molibdopterin-dependent oxidoreductase YjgC